MGNGLVEEETFTTRIVKAITLNAHHYLNWHLCAHTTISLQFEGKKKTVLGKFHYDRREKQVFRIIIDIRYMVLDITKYLCKNEIIPVNRKTEETFKLHDCPTNRVLFSVSGACMYVLLIVLYFHHNFVTT